MRARMALLASDIRVELREVVLRDKPAEMLAISPKGTVPVLQLNGGRVIDESLDIMRWALGQNDPENWLLGDDPALIAGNDGPFKAALDRYKYPHRFELVDGVAHRATGLELLRPLHDRLMQADWLCGKQLGIADMAIFPFVRQFAATDQAWFDAQDLPQVQVWLTRCLALPRFAQAMTRYAPWVAGDAPVLFHQDEFFGH
jgi:glutathione S-transferase